MLRLLRTTSPSSLLLASLDEARHQLVLRGEQRLHETLEAISVASAKLETIHGIRLVDASGESTAARRRLAGARPSSGSPSPARPPRSSAPRRCCSARWLSRRAKSFLGEAEQVPVSASAGRISCESIASYPPGVPQLPPGERIKDESVAHLSRIAVTGARLHGASDPSFRTINVPVQES